MKQRELEVILERVTADLESNGAELAKVVERLNAAATKKDVTNLEYEDLRKDRQIILGKGENSEQITIDLKACKERIELVEDEVTGLEAEKQSLSLGRKLLENNQKRAGEAVDIAIAQNLAKAYNEKAEELALIVKPLNQMRLKLERRGDYASISAPTGWSDNALGVIPRIFIKGEVCPKSPYDQVYFTSRLPER